MRALTTLPQARRQHGPLQVAPDLRRHVVRRRIGRARLYPSARLFGGEAWSAREAGFVDPVRASARIRAFCVYPAHPRRGGGGVHAGGVDSDLRGVPYYAALAGPALLVEI